MSFKRILEWILSQISQYLCRFLSFYSKTDIDECQNGIANCSQICSNLDGRYECLCYDGYNKSGEDCIQGQVSYN